MSAVNPTQNTALIVDEFIRYAQAHLATVSGVINMTTLYQAGPATIPGPGLLTWTGYNVEGARPTPQTLNEDDFPAKENVEPQNSQLQTNEINNGVTEDEVDDKIKKLILDLDNIPGEDTPVRNIDDVIGQTKFNTGKPFVSGFKAGGFTPGFSGAVTVDLGALNLGADWVTLSAQFIGKNEGFAAKAAWDYNAWRLGFGSDKIIGADGKIRDVLQTDVTTVDAALKMLQYEVSVSYKNRLVGNGERKISEEQFNALNNKQKAALLSYVYNCGSLKPAIAAAIKSGNFGVTVREIQAGPITAGGSVLPGLVRRRSEEASLFSS